MFFFDIHGIAFDRNVLIKSFSWRLWWTRMKILPGWCLLAVLGEVQGDMCGCWEKVQGPNVPAHQSQSQWCSWFWLHLFFGGDGDRCKKVRQTEHNAYVFHPFLLSSVYILVLVWLLISLMMYSGQVNRRFNVLWNVLVPRCAELCRECTGGRNNSSLGSPDDPEDFYATRKDPCVKTVGLSGFIN